MSAAATLGNFLLVVYVVVQLVYLLSILVNLYFFTRHVDWVPEQDIESVGREDPGELVPVALLYPVLRETEATMRTTLLTIGEVDYPRDKFRVIAIPNHDDTDTVETLLRLQQEFDFLEVLPIPPTTDPSWAPVWADWDTNTNAYWWHVGKRKGETSLPAKKTRQMVYALYTTVADLPGDNWLLSYLDADSAVPPEYFRIAAAGERQYDVIQLTNVCGNLLDTWATTYHSMDHMGWDGSMYPHMSARGKHPFYVLGKGLFFRVSDLLEFGGFHPWLTIEDPEVGMRLWTHGKTLGVSDHPLVEEVPQTFRGGVTQRKRWVAGFFQALGTPLTLMGMSPGQRFRARLNFLPTLLLSTNVIGLPIGVWAIAAAATGRLELGLPLTILSVFNIVGAVVIITNNQVVAWRRTALVLDRRRDRLHYLWRVNPVFLLLWWLWWLVPLAVGFQMFVRDRGLTWERTEKVDANHVLIRGSGSRPADVQAPGPEPDRASVPSPGGAHRAGVDRRDAEETLEIFRR